MKNKYQVNNDKYHKKLNAYYNILSVKNNEIIEIKKEIELTTLSLRQKQSQLLKDINIIKDKKEILLNSKEGRSARSSNLHVYKMLEKLKFQEEFKIELIDNNFSKDLIEIIITYEENKDVLCNMDSIYAYRKGIRQRIFMPEEKLIRRVFNIFSDIEKDIEKESIAFISKYLTVSVDELLNDCSKIKYYDIQEIELFIENTNGIDRFLKPSLNKAYLAINKMLKNNTISKYIWELLSLYIERAYENNQFKKCETCDNTILNRKALKFCKTCKPKNKILKEITPEFKKTLAEEKKAKRSENKSTRKDYKKMLGCSVDCLVDELGDIE